MKQKVRKEPRPPVVETCPPAAKDHKGATKRMAPTNPVPPPKPRRPWDGNPVFKVFKVFSVCNPALLVEALAPCVAVKCISTSAWIVVWLVFGCRGGVYGTI